jgi:exopolysaccharide production protein ExoZ
MDRVLPHSGALRYDRRPMRSLHRWTGSTTDRSLPTGERLEAVQALRAIAAGLVVFSHGLGTWATRHGSHIPQSNLENLGNLGVKIFFVISGFIIAGSAARLPVRDGVPAANLFLRRRLVRIVPLYWLVTVVIAGKELAHGALPPVGDIVRSLLFIPFDRTPVLAQGWTLNFEMFFYVVFGLVLLLGRTSRYIALFAVMGVLVILRQAEVLSPEHLHTLYLFAQTLLLYFLAGVALALVRDPLARRATLRVPWSAAIAVVAALIGGFALAIQQGLHNPQALAVDLPISVVCVAICALPHSTGTAFPRLRALLVRAGDGSYSTYLTHALVLGAVARVLTVLGLDGRQTLFAIAEAIGCTLVGIFIYDRLERPTTRRLNARFARRPAQAALAPDPALAPAPA